MVQVQNLALALGMALKFCTKFRGLIPTFVEVT